MRYFQKKMTKKKRGRNDKKKGEDEEEFTRGFYFEVGKIKT